MATTTFTDYSTVVPASWLNDVNDNVYEQTPGGVGAATRALSAKLFDTYSVEDFGAVGDGVTDDHDAIYNAVIAANGRKVLLKPGKTYLIGSQLNFSGIDVNIEGNGSDLPVIYQSAQAFDAINITTTSVASTTLSASMTLNTRGWTVASTTGITAGMLVEIRSSASWYYDPRPGSTDVRKSELHRVAYVSGSLVYTEDASYDGYDIGAETVTLTFYNPVSVTLKDFIVRGVRPAPAVGVANKTGLIVKYGNNAIVENVCIENHLAAGISFQMCYKSSIIGGYTDTSNAFGTGYGVSVNGSTYTHVFGRRFFQCRRGVDVTGAIVCRHTLIENCNNPGGGQNSEGTTYGWEAAGAVVAAPQFGFGSHGGADYTTYRGNTVSNMHSHINCRGRNEYVENNLFIGRSRFGVIMVSAGENIWIRNNKAYSGYTGSGKETTVFDGAANIHSRRADYFFKVHDSYEGLATGQIVVENNDVECQENFINCDSLAVPANLSVRNNKVRFATAAGATEVYLIYNEGALTIVDNWSVANNDYRRDAGTGRVWMYGNLDSRDGDTFYQQSKTYMLFLADDQAKTIYVPEAGVQNRVRVLVDAQGSAYGCVNVIDGSATQDAIGTPANITNQTVALLGTTGTDTQLNISLVSGLLYVENRLGLDRRVLITVQHAF